MRVQPYPPWYFRLAKKLIRKGYPGGWRFLKIAAKLGWLNLVVRYSLNHQISIEVPLFRTENRWDERLVREYEANFVNDLAEIIGALPEPVSLVDCGADIGIISIRLAAKCPNLTQVTALEPNPTAYEFLARNIQGLPFQGEARCVAVSDFSGSGELRCPDYSQNEFSRFLVPASTGSIPVVRIDDLPLGSQGALILKIDTEGAELNVIRGAQATLARVGTWVVAFEAHRKVVERTGVDPLEVVLLLCSIRPCRTHISELPQVPLRTDRKFFDQIQTLHKYTVVCVANPHE